LRVLLYLAVYPERLVSTQEISEAYGISRHHLIKVVNNLGHLGYIAVKRGRSGGIRLAHQSSAINLGEVVRQTEPNFSMAECFSANNTCPVSPVCGLKPVLGQALGAYLAVLDSNTLDTAVGDPDVYRKHLELRRQASLADES
jgi:Rrf2 family nitric oxide-sensitive transcriptional repressor